MPAFLKTTPHYQAFFPLRSTRLHLVSWRRSTSVDTLMRWMHVALTWTALLLSVFPHHVSQDGLGPPVTHNYALENQGKPPSQPGAEKMIYLPLVAGPLQAVPPPGFGTPRINAPYFESEVAFAQTAIFWFGRITPSENYVDVRVGYNDQELFVHVSIFDRSLWYDKSASINDLTAWDSVSLLLDRNGNTAALPGVGAYRFAGQLSGSEDRSAFQASYQGSGSGWEKVPLAFTTERTWRGQALNNTEKEDRGWSLQFHIPFASLGLSGPPAEGTTWGLGVSVHDRDDGPGIPGVSGASIPDQTWPDGLVEDSPATWGQIRFGLTKFDRPPAVEQGAVSIRNKDNGARVIDGEVGGGTVCGSGLDWWTTWGETSTPGSEQNAAFNIQNQFDVADWPCFSKYYLTIPLDAIPAGKVILSAALTLHQFGNSGGGEWGTPPASLIQVSTVIQDWDEATLTWNNAPLAFENVSQAWVETLTSMPDWPGAARVWDLSLAVARAYAAGQPLRLVFYSADSAYHSGKYFSSSDAAEWNKRARPTLDVTWGNPA